MSKSAKCGRIGDPSRFPATLRFVSGHGIDERPALLFPGVDLLPDGPAGAIDTRNERDL
jgi:hypothetical protein